MVFSRSPHAGVTAFHLDLGLAPLSFDKQPATRNPRYWVSSSLGAVGHAQRIGAIEAVAGEIAPRRGWTPGQDAS